MSPKRGSKPRRTDRLVVGRNVTLTLTTICNNNIADAGILEVGATLTILI
jgi:hypothetical protein